MQQSTNYNMNKPDLTDQYNLAHWNQNTDIIDTELKKREDDDTALKNPVYTEAGADAPLVSGELFTTAFGKIAKAISSFITHKGTTTSVHGSTPYATARKIIERDANARAKVADASLLEEIATFKQIYNNKIDTRFLAVKVVASSNITLSGEQVIDGVNCVVNDWVLALAQTTATQNGVYRVETGAWTRLAGYRDATTINRSIIGVLNGTHKGKMYKSNVNTFVDGTTILTFTNYDYYVSTFGAEYYRKKFEVCREYRPPIGVPTLWLADKPSWAIDFGNGASTKYLWSNYPELNNNMFKSILTRLSGYGWMTAHDNEGFYVPDLRGISPTGYGDNGIRTEVGTITGSYFGSYSAPRNLYHRHSKGDYRITGQISWFRTNIRASATNESSGALYWNSYQHSAAVNTVDDSSGSNKTMWKLNIDTNYNSGEGFTGNSGFQGSSTLSGKGPTIGCMWIVRFE